MNRMYEQIFWLMFRLGMNILSLFNFMINVSADGTDFGTGGLFVTSGFPDVLLSVTDSCFVWI